MRAPGAPHEPQVARGFEPEPQSLGPHQPAGQQVVDQRLPDVAEVERRAGAVHEPVADDTGLHIGAPGPEADRDAFVKGVVGFDRAGPDLELTARLHLL